MKRRRDRKPKPATLRPDPSGLFWRERAWTKSHDDQLARRAVEAWKAWRAAHRAGAEPPPVTFSPTRSPAPPGHEAD